MALDRRFFACLVAAELAGACTRQVWRPAQLGPGESVFIKAYTTADGAQYECDGRAVGWPPSAPGTWLECGGRQAAMPAGALRQLRVEETNGAATALLVAGIVIPIVLIGAALNNLEDIPVND